MELHFVKRSPQTIGRGHLNDFQAFVANNARCPRDDPAVQATTALRGAEFGVRDQGREDFFMNLKRHNDTRGGVT
jgi:hypothetical protein